MLFSFVKKYSNVIKEKLDKIKTITLKTILSLVFGLSKINLALTKVSLSVKVKLFKVLLLFSKIVSSLYDLYGKVVTFTLAILFGRSKSKLIYPPVIFLSFITLKASSVSSFITVPSKYKVLNDVLLLSVGTSLFFILPLDKVFIFPPVIKTPEYKMSPSSSAAIYNLSILPFVTLVNYFSITPLLEA